MLYDLSIKEFMRNEEDYMFWDSYPPTDKMLKQMVDLLWENGPSYSYPVS